MTLMSSLGSVLVAASLLLGGVASSSAIATDEVVLSILKNVGLLIAARWSTADFKCIGTEVVCLYYDNSACEFFVVEWRVSFFVGV
jgi:hypothetical protein